MSGLPVPDSLLGGLDPAALPGRDCGATVAVRRRAAECVGRTGLPDDRQELWRHTNLRSLAGIPFRPGDGGEPGVPEDLSSRYADALLIPLSRGGTPAVPGLPDGLRIHAIGVGETGERLGTLATPESDPFVALNTALFDRGVVLEIAAGARIERPVHVVHVARALEGPSASFPRLLVISGSGSHATIVEHYRSVGGESLTAPVTEIWMGEGAALDHVRLQRESDQAFHVGHVWVEQARASIFRSWSLALGSRLSRVDVRTRLAGEQAACALEGLFAGSGPQHLDHYTRIDHASPNTSSRERYKGILGGRARGVFLGHVLVRPGAQKIDAMQTSRSVVLTDQARVNMKPWLEIYADDVRCTHGTTVGRLDDDALFYLRSRGIREREARALLIRAFASEVLGDLPDADLRQEVESAVLGHLSDELRGGMHA